MRPNVVMNLVRTEGFGLITGMYVGGTDEAQCRYESCQDRGFQLAGRYSMWEEWLRLGVIMNLVRTEGFGLITGMYVGGTDEAQCRYESCQDRGFQLAGRYVCGRDGWAIVSL